MAHDAATAADQPAKDEPKKPAKRHKSLARRRFVPTVRFWIVIGICLALILALRFGSRLLGRVPEGYWGGFLAMLGDHALVNILTLVISFVAFVSLLIWFVFRSGYPLLMRLLLVLAIPLSIGVFFSLFTIDHVSGELIPVFRYRWSKPAEEMGDLPASWEPIDLTMTTDADFPQFLGPDRDASVKGLKLARDWQSNPPRLVWRRTIGQAEKRSIGSDGAGWSGFAAVNGYAVTLEQRGAQELVTCYDIQTGQIHWWHASEARHATVLGGIGPRSTPTIHAGKVYTLGATGILQCLSGADAKLLWSHDLLAEYKVPPGEDEQAIAWGRAGSPLIVDKLVVVPAGGPAGGRKVSLVAFDKDTGEKIWEAGTRQISYASPQLATVAGVRQILSVNEDTVSGHNPTTGRVLWEHPWPGTSNAAASASQPVSVGDDGIFLSKAYGTGAALLRIEPADGGGLQATEVWHRSNEMKTKMTNVCVYEGHAYGLDDGIFECLEIETGRKRWKQGRYGHGQVLLVGDVILVLTETGDVVLVEATPRGHQELGRFSAIAGKTWNNPCLYGRLLLVRNAEEAACYELPVVP